MIAASRIKRQAVVVVHGQGQQRPMGTIRDFVEVLWTANPDVKPDPPYGHDTWIVPDEKSGLHEMQRITTPPHGERRTDFYELYYADLLADTPIRNLWRWLERLFWISPLEVPARMRRPWRAFWFASLFAMLLAAWVVLDVPQLLHTNWMQPFEAGNRLEVVIGVAIIAISLMVLIVPQIFPSTVQAKTISRWAIVGAVFIGLSLISWHSPVIIAAAALGLIVYVGVTTLLPLFGDAASYLSAQTETVRSRQAIRERGLALLKALHNDPECERIVIVAHSLGTVVAYDLLQLLWHSVGPTKNNPPDANAAKALKAVQDFARTPKPGWADGGVAVYQDRQWKAFLALSRQPAVTPEDGGPPRHGWKVSDFVSLGSPLANASFLVTEGSADFAKMKTERVLPISPPEPRGKEGFLYKEDGHWVTHHAAVFSTVRWTNIYDEFDPVWFWLGDVIGGAVSPVGLFGPGIKDVKVDILENGRRTFSHNLYWVDTRGKGEAPVGKGRYAPPVRSDEAADQIVELREAVGMERN